MKAGTAGNPGRESSGRRQARRAQATRLALTSAGRMVLVLTLGAWLVGLLEPGARPLAAVGAATLLAGALLALLRTRGLQLVGPRPARGVVGARLALELTLASRARFLAPEDLLFALGEPGAEALASAGLLAGQIGAGTHPVPLAFRVRRRGRVERLRVQVSSEQPLGLVRVTRAFELEAQVLGLPRRGRLEHESAPRSRGASALRGLHARGEEELSHVRDWREGESLHRLHWRLSARRGRAVLRELRAPTEPDVELFLATHVPGLDTGRGRRASFERAVSLAATLAEHHLRRGRRLTLSIEGEASARGLRGRPGLARVLTRLASVQPRAEGASALPAPPSVRRREHEEFLAVMAGGGLPLRNPPDERLVARVFDVDAPRGHPLHAPWRESAPLAGGSR